MNIVRTKTGGIDSPHKLKKDEVIFARNVGKSDQKVSKKWSGVFASQRSIGRKKQSLIKESIYC